MDLLRYIKLQFSPLNSLCISPSVSSSIQQPSLQSIVYHSKCFVLSSLSQLLPLCAANRPVPSLRKPTPNSLLRSAQPAVAALRSPLRSPSMPTGVGCTPQAVTLTATPVRPGTPPFALMEPPAHQTALLMVPTTLEPMVSPPLVPLLPLSLSPRVPTPTSGPVCTSWPATASTRFST
jgi:hypothetical protein